MARNKFRLNEIYYVVPPGGIGPPSLIPKTSTLSVELRRRLSIACQVNYTEIGTIVDGLTMVVCAERLRRCPVEAVLAGSTPVHHPKCGLDL